MSTATTVMAAANPGTGVSPTASATNSSTTSQTITPPYFTPASSASGSPTSPRSVLAEHQHHQHHQHGRTTSFGYINGLPLQPPHPATRQLRPPKSPLYVPAVLRKTEWPADHPRRTGGTLASVAEQQQSQKQQQQSYQQLPPTPPRSLRSSTDSLSARPLTTSILPSPASSNTSSAGQPTTNNATSTSASSSRTSTPGPSPPNPPPRLSTNLTRSFSRGSSNAATTGPNTPTSSTTNGAVNTNPPVQPTRAHWKPDDQATSCDAPPCTVAFSFLSRRHHCRRCGGIFCAGHTARQVPLDREAQFDEGVGNGGGGGGGGGGDGAGVAGWWRACDGCWAEWSELFCRAQAAREQQQLEEAERDDRAQGGSGGGAGVDEQRAIAMAGCEGAGVGSGPASSGKRMHAPVPASSVPRDWSWSTF